MAIGSDPEVGVEFRRWGEMSERARQAWFAVMRREWGTDLLGGYATLCQPDLSRWCTACGAEPDDDCYTGCSSREVIE